MMCPIERVRTRLICAYEDSRLVLSVFPRGATHEYATAFTSLCTFRLLLCLLSLLLLLPLSLLLLLLLPSHPLSPFPFPHYLLLPLLLLPLLLLHLLRLLLH